MFSTKLITTLKLVTKRGKELDNLRKFIHSEYHQTDKAVIAIFDTWDKTYHNDFSIFHDKFFWNIVFPERQLNDNVKRAYCSMLSTQIEQFFIQEELKKDNILQKQLLAKAYQGKNHRLVATNNEPKKTKAMELYVAKKQAVVLAIDKELESLILAQPLSSEKIKTLLFLKEKNFYHFYGKNVDKNNNTSTEYLKALDEFYFVQKLKFINVELTKGKIYQAETNVLLQKEVLMLSQKSDNPLIKIYAKLIHLFEESHQTSTQYDDIKAFFNTHKEAFDEEEKSFIYLQLKNYWIRKRNQGDKTVDKPLFDLYKETLELPIAEISFQNMVAAACLANELDYCDEFIATHAKNIKGKNKNILEKLARANLHFYRYLHDKNREHLDEILEINKKISTLRGDLTYNLSLRGVLCKTYFELSKEQEDYKALTEKELINLSQYIRKRNLAEDKRKSNLNFCKYLELIMNAYHQPSRELSFEALAKIKEELEEQKVVNKDWLMTQCKK